MENKEKCENLKEVILNVLKNIRRIHHNDFASSGFLSSKRNSFPQKSFSGKFIGRRGNAQERNTRLITLIKLYH